jgi:hypothetical protein
VSIYRCGGPSRCPGRRAQTRLSASSSRMARTKVSRSQTCLGFFLALAAPQTGFLDCAIMGCRAGMENLCEGPTFTGYTVDGGCAQCALTPRSSCTSSPSHFPMSRRHGCCGRGSSDFARCDSRESSRAGGWLYGFRAAAHLSIQVARLRGGRCKRARGAESINSLHCNSAPSGREKQPPSRLRSSTERSSSRLPESSSDRRSRSRSRRSIAICSTRDGAAALDCRL